MADHVLGVGLASRAEAGELAALVESTLTEAGIPRHRIATVATVDTRATHPALAALGWPVVAYPASELAAVAVERQPAPETGVDTPTPGAGSQRVAVAEPAALRAAGPGAVLVVPKRRSARATVAVARAGQLGDAHTPSDVRSSRPQKPQVSSS